MKKQISLFVSSACCIGLIPGAPGTYASLATAVIFFLIYRSTHVILPDLHLSAVCLISVVGIFSAAETRRQTGIEDPRVVVIDEVAGQLLTFLFIPVSLFNIILGFVLFRIFDIWKPSPIRNLERLHGGVGIMADDLMAGIYANIFLQIIYWAMQRFS
jgi:phosphatidylglycerophosphatase A